MEDILKIGNKEVKLSNNVAWLMEYRDQFGKDATQEFIPLISVAIETLGSGLSAYKDGTIDFETLAESIEGRSFEMLLPAYNTELSTMIINITWAMAKAADESIGPPKSWVRQFDVFPFDVIVPKLWEMTTSGFVSSKNLKRLRALIEQAKKAWIETQKNKETQPSHSTTLSSPESKED